MLVNNLKELKSLVEWAKSQKITRIKLGQIELDILPLSYVDAPAPLNLESELNNQGIKKDIRPPSGADKTWVDSIKEDLDSEDPDLYWSSK